MHFKPFDANVDEVEPSSHHQQEILTLTSGRELSVRTWLMLVGGVLIVSTLYGVWTDGTWDEVLIALDLVWLFGTIWRLSKFTRLRLSKYPKRLTILRGWLKPSETTFDADGELRVEIERDRLLFFRGFNPQPVERVRCQSEYECHEFLALIHGFFTPSAETASIANSPTPPRKRAFVSVLVAINVAIFLIDFSMQRRLVENGMLLKNAVVQGEYRRIWTSMFLHANFAHVFMNMIALFSLGSWLETMAGWKKTALIYFAAGTGGSLYALLWLQDRPMVGASGAIFGLFGAISWIVFRGARSGNWDVRYLPDRRQLFQDLAINFVISLLPFVSLAAHFGGFVTGYAISSFILKRNTPSISLGRDESSPN